jgi:hypothetical protein
LAQACALLPRAGCRAAQGGAAPGGGWQGGRTLAGPHQPRALLQAGDAAAMEKFRALFDDVKFGKGLEICFYTCPIARRRRHRRAFQRLQGLRRAAAAAGRELQAQAEPGHRGQELRGRLAAGAAAALPCRPKIGALQAALAAAGWWCVCKMGWGGAPCTRVAFCTVLRRRGSLRHMIIGTHAWLTSGCQRRRRAGASASGSIRRRACWTHRRARA